MRIDFAAAVCGSECLLEYDLSIFDCDGTLADTLPGMEVLYNEIAPKFGLKTVGGAERERLRDLHGIPLLRALNLSLWKLPRVVAAVRARMTAQAGDWKLFPGVAEALARLAERGRQLAIVSSNSRANVERVLGPEASQLIRFYDCSVSMFGKAPKIRRVLRRSGIAPERAIYVGDEMRDAEAARAAGIAHGAVAWGHHRLELLATTAPAACFRTVQELAEQLS
jgi:phosphoglycolate phosphatase